jgi:hypothetical protein
MLLLTLIGSTFKELDKATELPCLTSVIFGCCIHLCSVRGEKCATDGREIQVFLLGGYVAVLAAVLFYSL